MAVNSIYTEKKEILRNVCRSLQLYKRLRGDINQHRIFNNHEDLYALWLTLQEHVTACQDIPTQHQLELAIGPYKEADVRIFNKISLIIQRDLFKEDDLQTINFLNAILKKYYTASAKEQMHEALKSDDYERLKRAQETLNNVLNKEPIVAPKVVNPHDNMTYNLLKEPRDLTGILPIDYITGGLGQNETVGVILGPGSGKSTIGLQLCNNRVLQKKGAMYCSFEQIFRGDFCTRWCCLNTNSCRSEWEKGWEFVKPELRQKYEDRRELNDQYFRFLELADPKLRLNSIEDFFGMITEVVETEKFPLHTLIIDWYGLLRMKLQQTSKARTDQERRFASTQWMSEIHAYTGKYGITTVIFNQLNGEAASKKSLSGISQTSVSEDKSFSQTLDLCIVGSPKDRNSCYSIRSDKNRSGLNNETRVFLNGAYCRLEVQKDEEGDAIIEEQELIGLSRKKSNVPNFMPVDVASI